MEGYAGLHFAMVSPDLLASGVTLARDMDQLEDIRRLRLNRLAP